ncbi:MAG TPA: FtsQ-type POTRA domain-containing protein [Rhizomicrobium sp.]|nr:FtsQ-type POTRA domain-containing protein [Rhizomicrobium sp.]
MRSVRIERKPNRGRSAKAGRSGTRPGRAAPAAQQQTARRNTASNNVIAAAIRSAKAWTALRRPMLLLAVSLIAAALFAALFIGGYIGRLVHRIDAGETALIDDAGFGISQVHLSGNRRVAPETILAALGFEPGQSIFDADIHAARMRLEKLDWVASADVKRRYPDDISVHIVEKLPFALWQSSNTVFVVERNGNVITSKGIDEFRHLPLLLGDGGSSAADIVDAVSQHRAVAARIKAYQRVSERRWNLILDDGVIVKLPEAGWQKELDALEHLIIDKGILERDVSEIDLRSPTQYFFVLRSGEKKNEPRGNAA